MNLLIVSSVTWLAGKSSIKSANCYSWRNIHVDAAVWMNELCDSQLVICHGCVL